MGQTVNKNYVAGQWITGQDTIENRSPSNQRDLIGLYAQASIADVDAAIGAAKQAQRQWQATGLEHRYRVLMEIGTELIARSTELGTLLSREEGKILAEGVGEVARAGQFFTYFAAQTLRQIGDTADSVRPGVEIDVRREPVGTVVVISPWNFPMATASWKIAPALAFGNAVIWKPANLTPGCAVALTEIIARQDIPAGLFNLVMGTGEHIGQRLIQSREINAISFTGSVPVGRRITAAAEHFTKIQLEMGSKNALVVMDDCDLDRAVGCALGGAFSGTGQKCTASSRLVVHEQIHDAFVDKLLGATTALRVGDALAADTQIGPVVSASQLQSNLDYVALGRDEGAELRCGGARVAHDKDGFYMAPAIFTATTNAMRINREEMFAPIACVIKVGSYDEALSVVNDTRFGLTSGIMTQSLARASHFRRHANTGCVMVNLATAGTDYHVPFGGQKDSSYGPREQGGYAVEFYTTVKTAYIAAGDPV